MAFSAEDRTVQGLEVGKDASLSGNSRITRVGKGLRGQCIILRGTAIFIFLLRFGPFLSRKERGSLMGGNGENPFMQ